LLIGYDLFACVLQVIKLVQILENSSIQLKDLVQQCWSSDGSSCLQVNWYHKSSLIFI